MKKPPGIETDRADTVGVLLVSPIEQDHAALGRILTRQEWYAATESKWTIYAAVGLEWAVPILHNRPVAIVLSERDLVPGTWKDLLAEISKLSDPPLLIVASHLADEYLWAEALNLGAYDVLAKPFDSEEVLRVLMMAGSHKRKQREIRNRTTLKMAAVG